MCAWVVSGWGMEIVEDSTVVRIEWEDVEKEEQEKEQKDNSITTDNGDVLADKVLAGTFTDLDYIAVTKTAYEKMTAGGPAAVPTRTVADLLSAIEDKNSADKVESVASQQYRKYMERWHARGAASTYETHHRILFDSQDGSFVEFLKEEEIGPLERYMRAHGGDDNSKPVEKCFTNFVQTCEEEPTNFDCITKVNTHCDQIICMAPTALTVNIFLAK